MKRLLTIALAVLFVTSLSSVVLAERTALSIDGSIEILSRYQENIDPVGGTLGDSTVDNRVEEKINLNVDADMTDNVSGHIGLEVNGAWADAVNAPVDGRVAALLVEEAYIKIDELLMEELAVTAGVMNLEYSLRGDGNAMFLSIPEIGAFKAVLDYDPLYVDLVVGKINETRTLVSDTDLYALAIEYYLENESKIQVIVFSITDKDADISLSEYSAGVSYNISDDLEVFAQIGGQGGEWGDGIDTGGMAYNIGGEYTFSNVNLTPYVGVSYQSFSGDDDATKLNWVNFGDVDETLVLEADGDLRDHNAGPVGKIFTSNYNAIRVVGGCQVDEKTAVDAQVAFVSVTDEDAGMNDIWNGGETAAPAETEIGTEIDVTVTHQLTDDLQVGLGIGYVASGNAIEAMSSTGADDDALVVIAANAVLTF